MLFHSLLCSAILLASGTSAQYYGGGNGFSEASSSVMNGVPSWTRSAWPSVSSPPGTVMVQVVQVSNSNGSELKYFPDRIRAQPGSFVQFQFNPKNHTVTQSTFANPCVPIHEIVSNVTGFKSGFMPVSPNDTSIPVFSVQVNDTNPIWIYCGQAGHCQKGMAMVINEQHGSNKTLEAYKAAAALVPLANATVTSIASVMTSTSTSVVVVAPTSAVATSSVPLIISSSTGPAVPTFTGAATRELASGAGLAGLLVAGLAFAL